LFYVIVLLVAKGWILIEQISVEQKSNRKFKDTFFRTLFLEKARAVELYNALEDTDFPLDTPIQFFTGGDRSLTRRNNDLAYTINDQLLSIADHQATINPNMPLRMLPIATDILYTWQVDKKKLYRSTLLTIPTPKFYVLYNGKEKLKSNILRLSDAFRFPNHDFSMELTVCVVDISHNSGEKALQRSPSLEGYAYLVENIRQRMNSGANRDEAITQAVNHCIEKNILYEFLTAHYKEVCNMFDYTVTYEEEMAIRIEEAVELATERAMEKGLEQGLEQGLFVSAIKFMQNGAKLSDVVRTLGLSDAQVKELEQQFA